MPAPVHYDVALLTEDGEASWPGYQRQRGAFVDGRLVEPILWAEVPPGHPCMLVTGIALYEPGTNTLVRRGALDRSMHLAWRTAPQFAVGAIALPTEAEIEQEQQALAALAQSLRASFGRRPHAIDGSR